MTRRLATAALIAADGSAEKIWTQSLGNAARFGTVLDTIPLIASDEVRESLYERVLETVSELPEPLATQIGESKGALGRFVRIEIPGKQRVLTLSEVQVMSEGQNIALKKKASQSSTDFGGAASRASMVTPVASMAVTP